MVPSPYRFFNRALKEEIYDACIIPTLSVSHAANAVLEDEFSISTTAVSDWTHTTHEAPARYAYPAGGAYFLSSPFNGFDPSKPARKAASSRKRQRTTGGAAARPEREPSSEPRRKLTSNGQKRKEALDGEFRTYKIRMRPTKVQRTELDRCFKVARYAYNWANECVLEGLARPNHYELRNKWRANKLMDELPYANTPETRVASRIASEAIKQLTDAYASNFAKRRKDPTHSFRIQFRSRRRTPTETLVIEKGKGSPLRGFVPSPSVAVRKGRAECKAVFGNNLTAVGGIRLQDRQRVIDKLVEEGRCLKENAKIQWHKATGAYYLIYLYTIPNLPDPDPAFERKRIVATDPGCSPFQQWYSPTSGNFGRLLDGARTVLKAKCLALDALQSHIAVRKTSPNYWKHTQRMLARCDSQSRRTKRRGTSRRLQRKLAKDRRRLHGWMQSAHYDAANLLLKSYDIIVLPVLQIKRLTAKAGRAFGNDMARNMYTWSHYLFRQRVKSASARYPGRHVYETSEPGTSKTCTNCGFWNAALRLGDKVFSCPRCGMRIDRQIAGARNNFLAAYGMAVGVGWDGVP